MTRALAALTLALALISSSPVPTPVLTEDSHGWDCRIHGNRICGPTNDQGVPAGNYN
jgi:hypothetical protein